MGGGERGTRGEGEGADSLACCSAGVGLSALLCISLYIWGGPGEYIWGEGRGSKLGGGNTS